MSSSRLLILVIALSLLLAVAANAADVDLQAKINQINRINAEKRVNWQAGESPIASMPMDDFVAMLGVDFSLPDAEEVDTWYPEATRDLPAHYDWRDVDGDNFVTPVRYQGRCGSCVAFGCVAAVEAGIRIREDDPTLDVDLSEQHAFNCTFFSGCDMGSNASYVLSTIRSQGVVDEECFPYMSGGTGFDYDCGDTCADAASRLFKIDDYSNVWMGTPAIKQALMDFGPLPATYSVYEDFKYYVHGVYEHTWGSYLGGHQILIVGWDDTDEAWIVKNSWSESFGEDGYFRIKWSDCGINSGVTKITIGDHAYTPGSYPGGDCDALATHFYDTCGLGYEDNSESLSRQGFVDLCNADGVPQCVFTCSDQHEACNELAGCTGFCSNQWCEMDFAYLYDTCGLSIELEEGNPLSKEDAVAICQDIGYNSSAMKCILECIPQTDSCNDLSNCIESECPMCAFPVVDFSADVTYAEWAPLTVTFTRTVTAPSNCDPTHAFWDFGDGEVSYSDEDTVAHTYETAGSFTVEFRVTNAAGPGYEIKADYITIDNAPVDDDTVDDDTVDDDTVDDDTVDDDTVDDDTVDDDTVDDDTTDDDVADDDTIDDDITDDDITDDDVTDDDITDDDVTDDDIADDDTTDDDTVIDDDDDDDDDDGCGN